MLSIMVSPRRYRTINARIAIPRESPSLLKKSMKGSRTAWPREAGGKGLPLVDVVDIYEAVSRADGSIGWCHFATDVTATFFAAYLDDDGERTITIFGPRLR